MSEYHVYTGAGDAQSPRGRSMAVNHPGLHGADKYVGATAEGYDAKREQSPKWLEEDRIIKSFLDDLKPGTRVLDCPVGSGRFLDFYRERGFVVDGVDKSVDMLKQAQAKVTAPVQGWRLIQGSVLELPGDLEYDAALMIRLTRWLSPEECKIALANLIKVTRNRVIFTARVANHPHARPHELFAGVLADAGWHIQRKEGLGHDPDYQVIEVRPKAKKKG